MKFIVAFCLVISCGFTYGQSFSINTDGSTADPSAILDVKSDTKGLLLPRMNKAQKNAITSPATGLLVFQTAPDSIGLYYYSGSQWLWLATGENNDWKTVGNAGTDTAINFIGTTDAMPLQFRQNNTTIGLWNRNLNNYALGENALRQINTGMGNNAYGRSALQLNSIGINNTAFGDLSGSLNQRGSQNTFIGALANFGNGIDSLQNATAIGYQATVDTSNAIILGNNANVGIGTGKPRFKLHVSKGNSGNLTNSTTRIAVFEDDQSAYIQLVNPNANESGILAGNAATLVKSGFLFQADSSIQFRSGGNFNRLLIANNGNVGIGNTTPQTRLHVSRGTTASAVFFGGASAILESSGSNLLQLMNPSTVFSGVSSGTELTISRSSILFNADSSIALNTPGFASRLTAKNNGVIHIPYRVGINNADPATRLHINDGTTAGAEYYSFASAIFESSRNHLLQLMNPSTFFSGITSGTELTNSRSSIFFNADSSIGLNTPGFTRRLTAKNNGVIHIPYRVGINNADPQTRLHINDGTTAGAEYYSFASAIFESSRNHLLQLMNPSTVFSGITSGTELTNSRSSIFFNADSSIALNTPGFTRRLTVKNDGDILIPGLLGIGNTLPQTKLHVSRGITSGASYFSSSTAIVESSTTNFFQLMNPAPASASIISGSELTSVRSGLTFNADSSISLSTGGFSPRMTITNTGATGINTATPAATLDANGSFKLGANGTVNAALIRETVNINVGSIPANGELDVTVAVTNVVTTGAVSVSPATDLPSGILIASARVSAAGSIRIRYRNVTAAAIDPPLSAYYISVIQ